MIVLLACEYFKQFSVYMNSVPVGNLDHCLVNILTFLCSNYSLVIDVEQLQTGLICSTRSSTKNKQTVSKCKSNNLKVVIGLFANLYYMKEGMSLAYLKPIFTRMLWLYFYQFHY